MGTGHVEPEHEKVDGDQSGDRTWFCIRTKPKHEHIASASIRRNVGLETFYPRLQIERCRRGTVLRVTEPLFACYIFVRCECAARLEDIRYLNGVSSIVRFGDQAARVPAEVIEELMQHFDAETPVLADDRLKPGTDVTVARGAFEGMSATVLRVMPARQRVEVLLEILGRQTTVEVDRHWVALERESIADLVPFLAAA